MQLNYFFPFSIFISSWLRRRKPQLVQHFRQTRPALQAKLDPLSCSKSVNGKVEVL